MTNQTTTHFLRHTVAECEPPTPQIPLIHVIMAFAVAAICNSAFAVATNYSSASTDAPRSRSAQEEYSINFHYCLSSIW